MVYQIGEVRDAMTKHFLEKQLWETAQEVRKEKGWNEFWMIFHDREDIGLCNVIRRARVATNKRPPKMLASMCFHVVWDRGICEPEWILPRDIPYDTEVFGSDGNASIVYDSVKSLGPNILHT